MAKTTTNHYWVYILRCENDSYYTGYTTNLEKRYLEHINRTGRCKYTRSFRPIAIAQCWCVKESKSLAMHLENTIKRLSKAKKESLISMPTTLSTDARVQPVTKEKLRSVYNSKASAKIVNF
jgi:putative endonuclease